MANNTDETKKVSTKNSKGITKKNTTTKKTTTTKSTTNKNTTKKSNNTSKSTNKSNITKKSNSKTTTKKSTATKTVPKKTTTPKKTVQNKELEKTIIIEDIENKINNIVENKNVEVKEQVVEEIKHENITKLENAKYIQKRKNKHLLAIGVIISLLGIIALIITLIANRIVDKEFISDNAIILMVIASIIIQLFGAFIIINES